MKGGFVVRRHNELRDLEAELLNLVCNDVETEKCFRILRGKYWVEVTIRHKKQEWTSTPGVFGRGNDRPSLMLGMPPKCRIVRRSYPTTDLQQA